MTKDTTTPDKNETFRMPPLPWKAGGDTFGGDVHDAKGVYVCATRSLNTACVIANMANGGRDEIKTLDEWHEDFGDVLWWVFDAEGNPAEAPYVGNPKDWGYAVEMHGHEGLLARTYVGGWPGYHTHWTRLPTVVKPVVTTTEMV